MPEGGLTEGQTDLLTRLAIWLSLAAWTAAEWVRLSGHDAVARASVARACWTAGAFLALLHVALAFHFHHGWSQASAFAETARQTDELWGVPFGAGLYVNYAFIGMWLADALWWWRRPAGYAARPGALDFGLRVFLTFIFVNGTIVFGRGAVRIAGIVSLLVLAIAWRLGSERALEKV